MPCEREVPWPVSDAKSGFYAEGGRNQNWPSRASLRSSSRFMCHYLGSEREAAELA